MVRAIMDISASLRGGKDHQSSTTEIGVGRSKTLQRPLPYGALKIVMRGGTRKTGRRRDVKVPRDLHRFWELPPNRWIATRR